MVKEIFEAPLRDPNAEKPIIELEDVKIIFAHLDPIVAYNTMFYEKLRKEIEGDNWNTDTTVLGPMFCELAHFLKSYSMYINNFEAACRLIEKLSEKKPRFKEFLRSAKDDPRTGSKGIIDFLIMPVQRIPRYNLLLADFLKHTKEDHPDRQAIEKALSLIREVADFINEAKAAQDDYVHVSDLQSRLTNTGYNLLRGKRKLIREEDSICVKIDGLNDPLQDEALFLFFSDCILFGVKTRKKIDVKNWIWLQEMAPMDDVELMSFASVSENCIILTYDMDRVNERRKEETTLRGLVEGEITFLVAAMTVDGMTKMRVRCHGEKLVSEFLIDLAAKCGFDPLQAKLLYKSEALDPMEKLNDLEGLSLDSTFYLMPSDDIPAFPSLKGLLKRAELLEENVLVDFGAPDVEEGERERRGLQIEVLKEEFKMNPHSGKAPQVTFFIPSLGREESEYLLSQIADRVAACREHPVSVWKMMQSAEQKMEDAVQGKQSFLSALAKNTAAALMSPGLQRRGSSATGVQYEDPKVTMKRIREERAQREAAEGQQAPSPHIETVQVRLIPIHELAVNKGDHSGGGGGEDPHVDSRRLLREFSAKAVPKPPSKKNNRDSIGASPNRAKPAPPPPPKPRASSMIELGNVKGSSDSIAMRINAQIAAAEAAAATTSSSPSVPPKPVVPPVPGGKKPAVLPKKIPKRAPSPVRKPDASQSPSPPVQESGPPAAAEGLVCCGLDQVSGKFCISCGKLVRARPAEESPPASQKQYQPGAAPKFGGGGGGGMPPGGALKAKGFKKGPPKGAGPGPHNPNAPAGLGPQKMMKKMPGVGGVPPKKYASAPALVNSSSPANDSAATAPVPAKKSFAELKAEREAQLRASSSTPAATSASSPPASRVSGQRACTICQLHVPEGEGAKLDGKLYHESCVRCHFCHKVIDGQFVRDDANDRFVCLDCEKPNLGPKVEGGEFPCAKCGQVLVGTVVKALGKEYHKACFVCVVCGVGFTNGFLTNKDNEPVCDDHANTLSSAASSSPSSGGGPVKPSKPLAFSGGARGGLSQDTLAQLGMIDNDDDDDLSNKRPSEAPSGKGTLTPPPPPPGRRR